MATFNPVEWLALIYGKWFQGHPLVGFGVIALVLLAVLWIFWQLGIDKYTEQHSIRSPLTESVQVQPPPREALPLHSVPKNNAEILDQLSEFTEEGTNIQVQLETALDKRQPLATDAELWERFATWDRKFQKYAVEKIGRRYYNDFSDPTGIEVPTPKTPSLASAQYWGYVYVRKFRLREFKKDFPIS